MNAIIDLSFELLVDRSRIRDPYFRLLLAALGQELAKGSPWVAVNKKVLADYGLGCHFVVPQGNAAAA